jgi:citrate lyase subunit beta/citryl-CoA lyase
MPGANARALEKARTLPADGLIFDLEDAVAPDAKDAARRAVVDALRQGGYGKRECLVRINGLDTQWGLADAQAAARSGADAVVLPKVERVAQVRELERVLAEAGAPAQMAVWCMIETPRGVLRATDLAEAGGRLAGFIMGTSDLAKELNCAHTPDRLPLLPSLGQCLLAARAAGIAILDGVHLDLADDEGFAAACAQGRALGFDGKTLIHPKTIQKANAAFGPSAGELAHARRVIAAHAEALAQGKGIVVLEGKLIENLHVAAAQRLVALAEAIAERERA